jgi:hypothetical protein
MPAPDAGSFAEHTWPPHPASWAVARRDINADRRFGQLTKELKSSGHQRSKPGRPKKVAVATNSVQPVTAADLGVDRSEVRC